VIPGRSAGGRLTFGAAALLALTACREVPVVGNNPAAPVAPGPTAVAAVPTPAPIAISDIPAEAEAFQELRRQMAAHLSPGADVSGAEAELARIEARANRILHGHALSSEEEVQLVELQDLEVDLREADTSAARLEAALTDRARLLEGDIEQLQRARSRWSATLPASAEHEAPEAIQKRAADILETIDGLKTDLKSRRDEALTSLDRVSRLRSDLAAGRAQMSERRSQAQRRIFEISEAPIWKTPWAGRRMGRGAGERLARDFARLSAFAGQRGPFAGARFLLLFAASFGLILAVRAPARESAKGDPDARGFLRLIDRPVAAAALIALMALVWWTPSAVAPALFWDALWVALILTTATLLNRLFAKAIWRSVDALALASCLVPLRYLYEQEPLLDRLVLLLQVGLVIAALALDWKSGRWQAIFRDKWPRRFVTAVLAISMVSFSAAFVLAILGYVGTARLLRTGTIATDGLGMISIGLYSLLYGIAGALLATRAARALHLVKAHDGAIRRFLRRALGVLLAFEWISWSLFSFGLREPVGRALRAGLQATLSVGSATLSISGVLTFVVVLVATFLAAAAVKYVLEDEVLPRFHLSRGLPFTITTTTRYAILVAGIFLALSAAGISLSRFTLLAGALGVGLGFGLQNIVSNFVAGLILLFERPIQVGDVVDVGSLVGTVNRIGMRSSTVRTGEGAEVIVPNGDLISKSFINWTLSDRRRRVQVRVGVAYGTDPEKVIALLLQAASDHPEALTDPAPAAFFVGFGDSSLDFVLHVWAARFEQTDALQSAVRRAVNRVFTEAGIEIPFPQRDVNLKPAPPSPAPAPASPPPPRETA
jgi:small-conductance mechanosensitive channel